MTTMTTLRWTFPLWLLCSVCPCYSDERGANPLADVQEVLSGYQTQVAAIQQRADAEARSLRERTIQQLQTLQDNYCRAAKLDEALAVREQIRRLRDGGEAPTLSETASPIALRGRVGHSFNCQLTGATSGYVWGTDVYTDDSELATAAVHAGALRAGETGVVKVTILGPLSNYPGSARNGVSSASWSSWGGSFQIELVRTVSASINGQPASQPDPGTLVYRATQAGQVFYFEVTGSTSGIVWGTELYTTDSQLAVTAVHAGVLQAGQRGTVKVTILAGQPAYSATTRNGVTTHPWGSYPLSFRVEPAWCAALPR